ncbi:AraC family transcriptional regulator [Alginatibacterium sediminis]|uniref:AraC family transcriptional regulator n=1 Tax=Alginatibacterium sediminis TaxID=2164068 RepID=A0A420EN33_9ALTE|nr:AraC family transcriptional regulator [Alginatibacterium sediminis]RKF22122.1 AraC family transcriptional regulator [Alginatibacterium sediminis]
MQHDASVDFKQSLICPQIELRKAWASTACYHAHSHDEFSFGLIDQGSACYINGQRTHQIKTGDLVTINPNDVHSCNPEQGFWSYRMLFIDTQWLGGLQQELFNRQDQDYFQFLNDFESSRRLNYYFDTLVSSIEEDNSALDIESNLLSFLEHCFASEVTPIETTSLPVLSRVRDKLLDQIDCNQQLVELAQEAGLSRYQLIRSFKQQYGLSPHAYLLDERIKRSKQMLKNGDTIIDISTRLGFADQAHFQRHFKSRLATTPKAYQSYFL